MQTAAEKPADGRRLAHLSAGPSFKFTAQQAEGENELSLLAWPAAGTQLAEFNDTLQARAGYTENAKGQPSWMAFIDAG